MFSRLLNSYLLLLDTLVSKSMYLLAQIIVVGYLGDRVFVKRRVWQCQSYRIYSIRLIPNECYFSQQLICLIFPICIWVWQCQSYHIHFIRLMPDESFIQCADTLVSKSVYLFTQIVSIDYLGVGLVVIRKGYGGVKATMSNYRLMLV